MKCNAIAVARYTTELFPSVKAEVEYISGQMALPNGLSTSPMGASAAKSISDEPAAPRGDAGDGKQDDPELPGSTQASMLDRKLSLESVLRSL